MKATNQCPKCKSKEIYTNTKGPKRGDRSSIGISSWSNFFIDVYVCLNCGFLEEYMDPTALGNGEKMTKLKNEWKKAG